MRKWKNLANVRTEIVKVNIPVVGWGAIPRR